VLEQAEYLSQRYQVVVANPPYMGGKGMNGRLSAWAKANYPDSKADLYAMFIERNLDLVVKQGAVGMITMQNWMFLSSYEKLRANLLQNKTLTSMAHLGSRAFDSIGGEVVSTTAFVFENAPHRELKGDFLRLVDGASEDEKDKMLREAIRNRECGWFYCATTADFQRIPGGSIAYWASERVREIFSQFETLSTVSETREGLTTGNNDLFLRLWPEVAIERIGFDIPTNDVAKKSKKRWFAYVKGGEFRKWAGNYEYVVNWENDGATLKVFADPSTGRIRSHNYNGDYAFRSGFTWSGISTGIFAVRHVPSGFMFDAKGPMGYPLDLMDVHGCEAFLNSAITNHLLKMLAPTLDFKLGHILNLPFLGHLPPKASENVKKAIGIAKSDWDIREDSWDFSIFSLLESNTKSTSVSDSYRQLSLAWTAVTLEMQHLEEENNRIFIDAYGLQDELKPDVPLSEITLTCNPHHRYGGNKTEPELEDLLRADTMREFISYAVGCMFGRYSLDQPGLVLANQGETLDDYLRQVPQPRFMPDEDNVIPLLDGDWFTDDITGRFREFLRITFGDEHYEGNLRFIEIALGKKDKPLAIRDYFLKEFYTDHVKRYKKRPIYWLFSSPKGSFNALIYLHRYRPDTASIVLQYLRDFRSKLASERDHQEQMSISPSASQGEKTKALKKIEELKKTFVELDDYERDTLYPLATQKEVLDLDDGVKVNYVKLGAALKKIPGLEAKDDE
jgi:type II restriction/modification system DNA methylase subunit YeeA